MPLRPFRFHWVEHAAFPNLHDPKLSTFLTHDITENVNLSSTQCYFDMSP